MCDTTYTRIHTQEDCCLVPSFELMLHGIQAPDVVTLLPADASESAVCSDHQPIEQDSYPQTVRQESGVRPVLFHPFL